MVLPLSATDMGSVQQVLDNYEVLYKILHLCNKEDQQAAYKTCRAMRDVCNLNVKTVFTAIHTDAGCRQIQRSCSLCPRGAYNIRNLHVICQQGPGTHKLNGLASAFTYLEKLLDSQVDRDRAHDTKQLATVRNLNLSLFWDSQTSLQLPRSCMDKLRYLALNIRNVTANGQAFTAWQAATYRAPTKITSLTVNDITSQQLRRTPTRFSKLVKLDVKFTTEVVLPSNLIQLKKLRQLRITISRRNTDPSYFPQPDVWAPIASLTGLTSFQLYADQDYGSKVVFPAATLVGLSQLQQLQLSWCKISEPFLLASMPCIRQFAFGGGSVYYPDVTTYINKGKHCWPALRSLVFTAELKESELHALQLHQPRHQVRARYVCHDRRRPQYVADRAADAQVGFLGLKYLAVLRAQGFVLFGPFAPSVLRAMSQQQSKYPVRELMYCHLIQAGDVLGLQLPSLRVLCLVPFEQPGPELFQAILMAFPALSRFCLSLRSDNDMVCNITATGRKFCFLERNRVRAAYAVMPC